MTKPPFDFFKDLTEPQQNTFLRQYLIDTTRYLKSFAFPHSPGSFYYQPQFIDDAYHGNAITNLAALLVLLMRRDYLLPIRLNNRHIGNTTEAPYFVFVNDVKELNDMDFTSFEYIQQDELDILAKVLVN